MNLEHPLKALYRTTIKNQDGTEREVFLRDDIVLVTHEAECGVPSLYVIDSHNRLTEAQNINGFAGYEEAGRAHVFPAAPGWYVEGADWSEPIIAWHYNEQANRQLKAIVPPDAEGYSDGPISPNELTRFVLRNPTVA